MIFLLSLFLPVIQCATLGHHDSHLGTFQNPSIHVRPKFRYWIPDASVDHEVVGHDVRAAAKVGAGGLECLGFYLYGGPPANGGRGVAAPVSWATYGFGTDAWNSLFKSMLQATKDSGLLLDFAMGPNQGTGVPAAVDSDGLMWDLEFFNVTVPVGETFQGKLPGWGTGKLEAAVTGLVTKSESTSSTSPGLPGDYAAKRLQYTLAADSLKDVTEQVDGDGHLNVKFNNRTEGIHNVVFAFYLIHSLWRAQDGPLDIGGPQTPAHTLAENGSWAVDHFASLGAQTMTKFWEDHILQNGTKELLMDVGNYGWEDSVEIQSNIYYTKDLQKSFMKDHGYMVSKYLPTLMHRDGLSAHSDPSEWWITDEGDGGISHIADYRQTLANLYRQYLSTLSTWARDYLGLKFSAQVSYNLPMDMLSNIPSVDVPECESLDFSDLIDGYRQYSGPAHLAGKPVVSSECGAVPSMAFQQTMPDLLWKVKRSHVGSINQFVFHGFPYSGNYGNTTWPCYTTFSYAYSDMHGPSQPGWTYYRQYLDFVARGNYILQTGTLRRDVAFWQKKTIYHGHTQDRTYFPNDLELSGYTYEYLSPDNLELPYANVENKILAPHAQGFKALVIRGNDSMTVSGAEKIVGFANKGLPIIFYGGIPESYLDTNTPGAIKKAQDEIKHVSALPNVHVTPSTNKLVSTLTSMGIHPATKFETASPGWYTLLRSDSSTGNDYYYVYNDAPYHPAGEGVSSATIEFASTGRPYVFDLSTGEQTPLFVYDQSNSSTMVSITLAGNQSTVIAFLQEPMSTNKHLTHLKSVSSNVIGQGMLKNGNGFLKATEGSASYTMATGVTKIIPVPKTNPITLSNWNMTIEHWDPPHDLYDIEGGAAKHNTTHQLESLVSWQQIPGLQNVSGRAFYSTSFQWKPSRAGAFVQSQAGAIIDFGVVIHTLSVKINGQALPPLDVAAPRLDITKWLQVGKNIVLAEVATPLGNVLQTVWSSLETSGTGPGGTPRPLSRAYGLVKDVTIQPYWSVLIEE